MYVYTHTHCFFLTLIYNFLINFIIYIYIYIYIILSLLSYINCFLLIIFNHLLWSLRHILSLINNFTVYSLSLSLSLLAPLFLPCIQRNLLSSTMFPETQQFNFFSRKLRIKQKKERKKRKVFQVACNLILN